MTKAELIEKVQSLSAGSLTKKGSGELVDAVFEEIAKTVRKTGRFTYPGFGTFTLKKRKARVGRNPQTGEEIRISPSKTVVFKPAPDFKDALGPARE